MLHHFDISKNVKTWTVSQNFDISKSVKAWTVSQNFDTSKNVKAWVVSQNIHTINNVKVWAASQHTDTSKSTTAALGCCYALHGYMETIFNHDRRLEVPIHSTEMEIEACASQHTDTSKNSKNTWNNIMRCVVI